MLTPRRQRTRNRLEDLCSHGGFHHLAFTSWGAEKNHYNYSQYLIDATVLLAHLRVDHVSGLGTSMGGILGMMASMPNRKRCTTIQPRQA